MRVYLSAEKSVILPIQWAKGDGPVATNLMVFVCNTIYNEISSTIYFCFSALATMTSLSSQMKMIFKMSKRPQWQNPMVVVIYQNYLLVNDDQLPCPWDAKSSCVRGWLSAVTSKRIFGGFSTCVGRDCTATVLCGSTVGSGLWFAKPIFNKRRTRSPLSRTNTTSMWRRWRILNF